MDNKFFYLLNVENELSEIFNKEGIINCLKKYGNIHNINLPKDISFSIKNRVLKAYINNVTQNMQVDSAAFEGWIIVIKTWLATEVKYVELDFEVPVELAKYGSPKSCHYNRFLYRINNLLRLFPNWFFLHESKKHILREFMHWIKSNTCLLNHSLHERESVIGTDKMERQIESWFAFEGGKAQISRLLEINRDKIFNQLPVGVFYEKIASTNAIFTRGASAVDLWGIGNDNNSLHLIELKCGNNKGLGVISEILFYTSVIYDTCIAEDTLFGFGKYGKKPDTKDMEVIKNGGNKFEKLHSHILAEQYHPLFSDSVVNLIKEGLSNLGIMFDRATYSYEMKVILG